MAVLTYYVNANTGSDSNDGSSGSPWLTFAHAISTADWATADAIVFHLTGSFVLSSVIDATNFNTYPIPVLFTSATLYGATITHNHATNGIIGNWAYRRVQWHNIDFIQGSTGALFTFFANCDHCRLDATSSTIYLMNTVQCHFNECVVQNTSGSAKAINYDDGTTLTNCTIKNYRFQSITNGDTTLIADRCRFVQCGESAYYVLRFPSLAAGNYTGMQLTNCSFVECAGSGGLILNSHNANVSNNVFVDNAASNPCFDGTNQLFACGENYGYNAPSGSPTLLGPNGVTTLSSDPYTDPVNDDWTLSAELAALTGSNGLTPGAVQAASGGGGGSRQVNIRGGADQ